jgi:hypothetical protein
LRRVDTSESLFHVQKGGDGKLFGTLCALCGDSKRRDATTLSAPALSQRSKGPSIKQLDGTGGAVTSVCRQTFVPKSYLLWSFGRHDPSTPIVLISIVKFWSSRNLSF